MAGYAGTNDLNEFQPEAVVSSRRKLRSSDHRFTKLLSDPIWNTQCRCGPQPQDTETGVIIMEIEDCQRQFTRIIEGMR